jgi:hypothetical protein
VETAHWLKNKIEFHFTPISTERNSATLRDKISQFLLGKS